MSKVVWNNLKGSYQTHGGGISVEFIKGAALREPLIIAGEPLHETGR